MSVHRRQIFLESFLSLYGVGKVEITKFDFDKVIGIAIHDDNGDTQEFCWYMQEDKVPSNDLLEMIQLIKRNNYNKTDKIIISPDELYKQLAWSDKTRFDKTYDELFEVEVKMIDDGEETDSFFMHD